MCAAECVRRNTEILVSLGQLKVRRGRKIRRLKKRSRLRVASKSASCEARDCGHEFARVLATEASRQSTIGGKKRERLAARLEKFLVSRYERIFSDEPGVSAGTMIHESLNRAYGPNWQLFFMGQSDEVIKYRSEIMSDLQELLKKRGRATWDAFSLDLIYPGSKDLHVAKNAPCSRRKRS